MSSSTLPPEIISDTLSRLPVKSLLRFRCASKPFCSIIDSPHFIKLHLNQTNSKSLILRNRDGGSLLSIDLRSLHPTVLEVDPPFNNGPHIIGSCNGLLCLHKSNSESEIVIWNMSTRKHHQFPHIHTTFPHKPDICSHQVAYGFGFDSVHHDYKLVRIVRFHNTLDSEVMVYSLKSNSWKKKECGFPYDFESMRSVGMFAEGALHWMIDRPLVVAFDLAGEEHREIPLPRSAMGKQSYEAMGWVFEDCLCAVLTHVARGAHILVLKHNNESSSWDKLLSITDPQLSFSETVVPMAYFSNGNELVLLQDKERFLRYDLKTNKVKDVIIHLRPDSVDTIPYVESLVKPFPMINATVGKHKGEKKAPKRDDFLSKGFKLVL